MKMCSYRCSILLLASALVMTAAQSPAAADTTGTEVAHAPGFTFGSNVKGYLHLSTDICDMKTAIGDTDTPGYAAARAIYLNGKNSLKTNGTIRTLRELAIGPYTGEPTWDLYTTHFGTPAFLDQPVTAAFAGTPPYTSIPIRNETIVKGVESVLQTVYFLHELDEAAAKIENDQLSAATGAPHNVDETWAIYVGDKPACSLWDVSTKRAREFGTMQTCDLSKVNAAMTAAHVALYEAATAGDLAAFRAQQSEVVRLLLITYIQATLKYAAEMDAAVAENDPVKLEADQAEGAMFFRTIEPFIAQANNRSAATIKTVFSPGNAVPTGGAVAAVKPALEATYAALNISPAEIGAYKAKQPSLVCPGAAAAAAPGALAAAVTTPAIAQNGPAGYTDTTGNQISHAPGFTFGSNVAGYLRLSTDICDIKTAIGDDNINPGYAEARDIYINGKNSYKTDGSIRTLQGLATTPYTGEPVYDKYVKYFGTPGFLNQPIVQAFAGTPPYTTVPIRNETIVKGIESVLQNVYLLHELDEAAAKIRNKSVSLESGAPHNVDETWAIYVGERPDCSLWGASQKRSMEFGTMQDCQTSRVNAAMLTAHRAMYEAAANGDLAAFQQQQEAVKRLLIITYIQATLKYATLMDRATAEGDQEQLQADQAEGYMFFRTIEPFIAEANARSAQTINNVLQPGKPAPPNALAIVKPALEAVYPRYNIAASDIGEYGAQSGLNCPTAQRTGSSAGATSGAVAAVPAGGIAVVVSAVALLLAMLY